MNQDGSIYTPLDSEKQEIRLLRIRSPAPNSSSSTSNPQPQPQSNLISCELATFSLHSRNFVALSYQWGTADAQHEILVNGRTVHIRQNLWDFLNVARDSDSNSAMLLWVDTLCIDQDNVAERNEHVQIMDEIYKASTMVISWLGTGDPEVEAAFDLVERVWINPDADADAGAGGDADVDMDMDMDRDRNSDVKVLEVEDESDRLPFMSVPVSTSTSTSTPSSGPDQEQQQQQSRIYSEEEKWQMVAKFCNLSYWRRVWVAQEILLPCSNYLVYGTRTLSWQAFANFLSLVDIRYRCPSARLARAIGNSTAKSFVAFKPYNMLPKRLEWKLGHGAQLQLLRVSGEQRWNRAEYNLFRILTIFGGRECTDPLDHIYALLPLTTQGVHFPVRYGIDLVTLFLTTFHFCGLATYHESNVTPGPVYEPPSQRALLRNGKYLAETLELIPVYQRSSPYLANTSPMSSSISSHSSRSLDLRTPNPRADPCFPCEGQWISLQCTLIVPGSEPPVLRSNTLRRSIENVPFDTLVHVNESSSWLMCRSGGPDQLVCIGVITLKDGPQGRGFRVIEPGMLGRSAIAKEPSSEKIWKMMIQPDAHLDFLNAIIFGISTK